MRGGRCSRCVRGYRTFERLMTIVVVVWARVAGMGMPVVTRAWTALDYSTVGGRLGVRSVRTSWRPGSAAAAWDFTISHSARCLPRCSFSSPCCPCTLLPAPCLRRSTGALTTSGGRRWSFFALKLKLRESEGASALSTQYSAPASQVTQVCIFSWVNFPSRRC